MFATRDTTKPARTTWARKLCQIGRFCFRLCGQTALSFCVCATLASTVGYPAWVNGNSMRPALNCDTAQKVTRGGRSWFRFDNDWVFVSRWAARHFEVERGDIVVLASPKDPYENVIKRVICVHGDEVVNPDCEPGVTRRLTAGQIWVEGDNRANSIDSNSRYGALPLGLVVGKATHIIWPPRRWQKLTARLPRVEGRTVEKINGGSIRLVNEDWI